MPGIADVHRDLYLTFHIDTNRINSRGRLEHMNRLETWRDKDIILLYMSKVANDEALAGHDDRRSHKASESIYSYTMADTRDERRELAAIEVCLFPGGARDQNQRNDVEIVFNAKKYGAILVTLDHDITDHIRKLRQLGISAMTDAEAVALVETRITERDALARQVADLTGQPLPDWVGKD
jgi:hypothetical protein